VIPVSGGAASFAEEGSPFNKVAGLGFGGVSGAAALDEIELAFTVCGAAVEIEIAHLGVLQFNRPPLPLAFGQLGGFQVQAALQPLPGGRADGAGLEEPG
jgi:hypothetical protein